MDWRLHVRGISQGFKSSPSVLARRQLVLSRNNKADAKIGDRHQIGAVKAAKRLGVLLRNLEPVTDFRVIRSSFATETT
jgi:hypothetical protein